jgi:toxin YoeB
MRKILFEASAFDDFNAWAVQDKRIYARIIDLIKDIQRSPFSGLGKPEPLKHELQGYWSRRMTLNIGWFIKLPKI